MSHRHYCAYAGHEWECPGTALRPLARDEERSICICLRHQLSMEDEDHSDCPAELLDCPEHREGQLQKMGIFSSGDLLDDEGAAESSTFNDRLAEAAKANQNWNTNAEKLSVLQMVDQARQVYVNLRK